MLVPAALSPCPPSDAAGSDHAAIDAAESLRRQAVQVDHLAQLLGEGIAILVASPAPAEWWGPARAALQSALDTERERLRRERLRLEGVVDQLLVEYAYASNALPRSMLTDGALP